MNLCKASLFISTKDATSKRKKKPIYSFKGRDSSATQNIYKIMHMGGSLIISENCKNFNAITAQHNHILFGEACNAT